jgi:hypothetical protein
MTYYLGPSLEGHKRKVRPNDRNETVEEEKEEPPIVPNDLRKADLSFVKDVKARCDQTVINGSIQRAPFFQRNTAWVQAEEAEPLGHGSGGNDQEPDEWDPERARYIGLFPDVSPEKKDNECPREKRC